MLIANMDTINIKFENHNNVLKTKVYKSNWINRTKDKCFMCLLIVITINRDN